MKLALLAASLKVLLLSDIANEAFSFTPSSFIVKVPSFTRLHAGDDGIDDIVKAYTKSKKVVDIAVPDPTPVKVPDTVPEQATTSIPDVVPNVVPDAVPKETSIEPITSLAPGKAPALSDYLKDAAAEMKSKDFVPPSGSSQMSKPLSEFLKGDKDFVPPTLSGKSPAFGDYMKDLSSQMSSKEYVPPKIEEGKVLPLGDYLKQMSRTDVKSSESSFDAVSNAKEKLAIFKDNWSGLQQDVAESVKPLSDNPGVTKVTKMASDPQLTKMISTNAESLKSASDQASKAVGAAVSSGAALTTSTQFQDLLEKFHFREYGSWYITGLALLVAVQQRNAGKEAARLEFEKQLAVAKEKADEAAAVAMNAADQAKKSKELAAQMQSEGTSKESAVDVLGESKRAQLEIENKMMKKELSKLTAQTAQLESQIKALTKKSAFFAEPSKVEPEVKVYEKMPRDPEEDSRILDVLKEIDQENKKKPKVLKKVKVAAKTKAAAKAKAKEADEAQAAAEAQKKAAEEAKAAAEEQEKIIAEAKAALEAEEKAKAEAKKAKPKPKTKPKASPKKKKVVETSKSSDEPHPWSKLSKSGLSRKTVKELSAFLSERGVATTDEKGKTFVKKILLEEVTVFL